MYMSTRLNHMKKTSTPKNVCLPNKGPVQSISTHQAIPKGAVAPLTGNCRLSLLLHPYMTTELISRCNSCNSPGQDYIGTTTHKPQPNTVLGHSTPAACLEK